MSIKKQISVNEMILATLKTKQNKKPKYYDELVKLGYPPIKTTWSCYDYWGFDTPRGELTFSKDYVGKRKLYISFTSVNNSDKNWELIDLENLIKKVKYPREKLLPQGSISEKIVKYKHLKKEVLYCKRMIDIENKRREKWLEEIKRSEKSTKYYKDKIDSTLKEIELIKK